MLVSNYSWDFNKNKGYNNSRIPGFHLFTVMTNPFPGIEYYENSVTEIVIANVIQKHKTLYGFRIEQRH